METSRKCKSIAEKGWGLRVKGKDLSWTTGVTKNKGKRER